MTIIEMSHSPFFDPIVYLYRVANGAWWRHIEWWVYWEAEA